MFILFLYHLLTLCAYRFFEHPYPLRVGIMNAFRAHSKLQPHSSELEGFETHLSAIECCRTHPAQVEQNRVGLEAAERIRVQSSAAQPTVEPRAPRCSLISAAAVSKLQPTGIVGDSWLHDHYGSTESAYVSIPRLIPPLFRPLAITLPLR